MQNWKFELLIYDGLSISDFSYASLPIGLLIEHNILRIFFSSRNNSQQSVPFFLDYDLETKQIKYLHEKPLLDVGELGCFDDSGVMPTDIIKVNGEIWMYYIGWNLGVTVPFRNSLGLAVSTDQGDSFIRKFKGPILDRTKNEPHFNASSCILKGQDYWQMWYLSCTNWTVIDSKLTHKYHIKTATSKDGIDWLREGAIAIDFKYDNEYAISVPRVIIENGVYKMWYSYRASDFSDFYRIGYAESSNGVNWVRKDEELQFIGSNEFWDSEMVCYPFVFDYDGNRYMLYNGNGYGKTGFGIAVLEK